MPETFTTHLDWTGAAKGATRDAATFSRDLELAASGMALPLSSAPGYKGDPTRLNPEVLFVGAISACQALTYLFLAARKQIEVVAYTDDAEGVMEMVDGRMRMSRVTLRPRITLGGDANGPDAVALIAKANDLIGRAHDGCFIANSVSTAVAIEPAFGFVGAEATTSAG